SLQVLRELDQLFDDLRSLDGPILILADGALKQLTKRPCLHDIASRSGADLAAEKLLQQLDREIPSRHVANLGQKFIGKYGDIWLLETGSGEDVEDFVRNQRARDDLPDRLVKFLVGLALTRQGLAQGGAHSL